MDQTLQDSPPVTDWFRGDAFHPALPGYYEVRNNTRMHHRSKHLLVGKNQRYWDGFRWLTWEGGHLSVFGAHKTHEWRGVRMWVVATDKCSICPGVRTHVQKIARRKTIHLHHNPLEAMAFATKRAADDYIGRHPRHALEYDLTAVLA